MYKTLSKNGVPIIVSKSYLLPPNDDVFFTELSTEEGYVFFDSSLTSNYGEEDFQYYKKMVSELEIFKDFRYSQSSKSFFLRVSVYLDALEFVQQDLYPSGWAKLDTKVNCKVIEKLFKNSKVVR